MNVLLINPPYLLSRDSPSSKTGANLPPLGLLYIAAYLRERCPRVNIQILDSPAYRLSLDRFRKRLKDFSPDIVGITIYTTTFSITVETAKVVKETFPNCIVAVGGPHASILPEECLSSPNIDIAVLGEGEEVFTELVECIDKKEDLDKVSNIFYKKNDKIVQTHVEYKMVDLDTLPLPARDLIDMKLYHPTYGTYRYLPATNMITSRGCPFGCTFCAKNVFGSLYRALSPIKIMEEIKVLMRDYGIREVIFYDDVFTIKRREIEDLCNLLIQEKLDFTWSCSTRANLIDPQLLDRMRKSGCISIGYGIESGDSATLDQIHKGFTLEDVRKAIRWTKKAGIETRAYYMLGFPREAKETIKQTIEISLELDADFVIYNLVIPLPGTEMYKEAKAGGLLLYDGIELYDRTDGAHPLIRLNDVRPSELMHFYNQAYKKYYLRSKYFLNQSKRIHSVSDLKRYCSGFFSFLSWYLEKKD